MSKNELKKQKKVLNNIEENENEKSCFSYLYCLICCLCCYCCFRKNKQKHSHKKSTNKRKKQSYCNYIFFWLISCPCLVCFAICFKALIDRLLIKSQKSRFYNFIIALIMFAVAIGIGAGMPNWFTNGNMSNPTLHMTEYCDKDSIQWCIYRQILYRVSFALCILFFILTPVTLTFDYHNMLFFLFKLIFVGGLFISFWFIGNSFMNEWSEICRFVSFFWLIAQGILFINFVHGLEYYIKIKFNSIIIEAIFAIFGLITAFIGLLWLFNHYSSCRLGLAFIIITLLLGLIIITISISSYVNKGFMTPCLVYGYSVFMTWYALLSNPNSSCNPYANNSNNGKGPIISMSIVIILLLFIVFIIILYGTNFNNILDLINTGGNKYHYFFEDTNNSIKNININLPNEEENEDEIPNNLMNSFQHSNSNNNIMNNETINNTLSDYQELDQIRNPTILENSSSKKEYSSSTAIYSSLRYANSWSDEFFLGINFWNLFTLSPSKSINSISDNLQNNDDNIDNNDIIDNNNNNNNDIESNMNSSRDPMLSLIINNSSKSLSSISETNIDNENNQDSNKIIYDITPLTKEMPMNNKLSFKEFGDECMISYRNIYNHDDDVILYSRDVLDYTLMSNKNITIDNIEVSYQNMMIPTTKETLHDNDVILYSKDVLDYTLISNKAIIPAINKSTSTDIKDENLIEIPKIVTFSKDIPNDIVISSKDVPDDIVISSKDVPDDIVISSKDIPDDIVISSKDIPDDIVISSKDVPDDIVISSKDVPDDIVISSKDIPDDIVVIVPTSPHPKKKLIVSDLALYKPVQDAGSVSIKQNSTLMPTITNTKSYSWLVNDNNFKSPHIENNNNNNNNMNDDKILIPIYKDSITIDKEQKINKDEISTPINEYSHNNTQSKSKNQGVLIINGGTLTIEKGSSLIIKGGSITIQNGGHLTIKDQSILTIEDGNIINNEINDHKSIISDIHSSNVSYNLEEIRDLYGNSIERAFFCFLLIFICCYCTMILTHWSSSNGETISNPAVHLVAIESMWLKIVSQWITNILYLYILYKAYVKQQNEIFHD